MREMSTTGDDGERADVIAARVAQVARAMLALGWQGDTVEVPELDETWTISREGH